MTKMQRLFWEMQCKSLSCKSASGMRWHPMMVRLAIRLESKGPGCYDEFRKIVHFPCKTTLQDYTHINPEHLGIRSDNIDKLVKNMPEHGKGNYVSLMFDEMTIREGVVFDSKSGQLIGYTNLDEVEAEIERLDSNNSFHKPKLAKKVLVFMAKNITGGKSLKEAVAIYAVTSATADQIYRRTWAVIEELENRSVKVLCLVCDGATTNRSFFKMMQHPDADGTRPPFSTKNIFSGDEDRDLFFISDAPHLIKCLRNNFYSHNLWKNGQEISWSSITALYERSKKETLRRCCKLTKGHVELDNFPKIKVFFAALVMSEAVASELQLVDPVSFRETINFIKLMDNFSDCLNGRPSLQGKQSFNPEFNPYNDMNDSRFQFLQDVLTYFDYWKEEVMSRPRNFKKANRKSMTITDETRNGIYITVNGFTGAVRHLLSKGINYVNGRDFNQDDLEQYFGHQKGIGRQSNNPVLKQVLQNDTKISLGNQLAVVVKKNAYTKIGPMIGEDLDTTPLKQRKRTRP
ncbi:uncharacterized protein LOC127751796 [Frankliniella occidentalis]|uniref:Uncharacterized protein LOC127751796 n=1 Tax=Frankliniella occidentalis TaxID=133901 RepID=A0A9C6XA11_FRAOC|nr:uncharacterized protein LOC127751796 [Frankliniella occidentalis]